MRINKNSGFTMLELLIVIALLAILSTATFRHYTNASAEAKIATVEQNTRLLENAVDRYRWEHDGTLPGTISNITSWENLVKHLTLTTDKQGNITGPYGPYLRTGIPPNSLNGSKTGTVSLATLIATASIGGRRDQPKRVRYHH